MAQEADMVYISDHLIPYYIFGALNIFLQVFEVQYSYFEIYYCSIIANGREIHYTTRWLTKFVHASAAVPNAMTEAECNVAYPGQLCRR